MLLIKKIIFMNSQLGQDLATAKSLLYLLLGSFLWGKSIDAIGNPGTLDIKIASRSHDLNDSFSAEVWVYPGSSDVQSVSLYVSYDSISLDLAEWELDPEALVDLTLVETHDKERSLIAFEGGFIEARTDSIHLLNLHFRTQRVSDSSFLSFYFSEDGPGTEVLNSSSRSLLTREDYEPVLLSVRCSEEPAYAGTDKVLCDNITQLKARISDQLEGYWTIAEGEGASFTDSSNPTTFFEGRRGEEYTLIWNVRGNTCAESTDTVLITFLSQAPASLAGEDQIVFGDLTYLNAQPSPSFTRGSWRILSDDREALLRDPADPKSAFIGEIGKAYLLEWAEYQTPCASQPDTVVIHFRRAPKAFAGEDQVIRNDNLANLKASLPDEDLIGVWNVISGGYGILSDRRAPDATFKGRFGLTYQLEWTLRFGRTILDKDTVEISFRSELSENPHEGRMGNQENPQVPGLSKDSLSRPVILSELPERIWKPIPRKNINLRPLDSDVSKDSSYFQPEFEEKSWGNNSVRRLPSDLSGSKKENRIDFFPNPVSNRQLTAYIAGELTENINYKILNINGQELLQGVWDSIGIHRIILDNLNPGIYTFSAMGTDGTKYVEKIYVK